MNIVYIPLMKIPEAERDAHMSVYGCEASIEELGEVSVTDALHLFHTQPDSSCPILAYLRVYDTFNRVCMSCLLESACMTFIFILCGVLDVLVPLVGFPLVCCLP